MGRAKGGGGGGVVDNLYPPPLLSINHIHLLSCQTMCRGVSDNQKTRESAKNITRAHLWLAVL